MDFSTSEQATLLFYQWEYRHRGYFHFDTPIDIEVPYVPFYRPPYDVPVIDDGRVPSLFKSLTNLLSPPIKEDELTDELEELKPLFISYLDERILKGISISFTKGFEIIPNRNIEFLNMLSFTEAPISFEIVANADDISIHMVCNEGDIERLYSLLKAYFPTAILREIEIKDFGFNQHHDIAIADFGMHDEFMRPIASAESFTIDPLTSIIATMDSLQSDDVIVFQMIFKGITSPLAKDISYAVSDGAGGSFFSDAPEMPICAKAKISNPLFSVVMRIATQGKDNMRSQYLAQELARSITSISTSEYNKLMPLSNEGYSYDFHHYNLHNRLSNRLGFILNSKELNTFIHYPNKTVVSRKLGLQGGKTKKLPNETLNQKYVLGVNEHNGIETKVTLNDEMRLRHTHIIGATGVGKSTLIANMMIEDMHAGNGCALFDPHGDIVEDVLLRIPEHRKEDVIIIDPSDENYSIGFNLLGATTDAEKIVLSSDLVSSFKRHATAWGDNMSAVLSNAINTFLESSRNGTLIELKRFLLEDTFRKDFLTSVEDPSLHYYWEQEYYMVKKGIAPLLTRIDTFLRPKVIRYMLTQTDGVDFSKCIEQKKIVLIKLSQGLIGEENSFLLGSLFLSKFNQVAQGRQSLEKSKRHPYYIYLDEFQNFITPSITRILSGARKYGLGLILAHQELAQVDDTKTLNSVISNPYTRICFRLGDSDAKRLESGFSYFEQSDVQSLGIGEAIVRVGSSNSDFNVSTFPLGDTYTNAANTKDFIVNNTRNLYSKTKIELDELLIELLPKKTHLQKKPSKEKEGEVSKPIITNKKIETEISHDDIGNNEVSILDYKNESTGHSQKEKYLKQEEEKEKLRKHRSIQEYIKTLASQRGYISHIEHEIDNGGRIDIVVSKDNLQIAFEVSVTNSLDYEVKNIQKCVDAKYSHICMVSESKIHLKNINKRAKEQIDTEAFKKIQFLSPSEILGFLDSFEDKKKETKRIRGYRVKSNHIEIQEADENDKNKTLRSILLKSLKKKKGGKK